MKEQKGKKLTIASIILAVLLALSLIALILVLIVGRFSPYKLTSVEVPGNIITPGEGSGSELTPSEFSRFEVNNLLPGDCETKYYYLDVSYHGDIVVRYHADIREGSDKLAEVLKVRVRMLENNEVLYDGLMRDMPQSVDYPLYTDTNTRRALYYEISAYLETSVGNEYADQGLTADFRWWVEETSQLDVNGTFDHDLCFWIIFACCLVILLLIALLIVLLVVLLRRKKIGDKEGETHEGE